jgi:hypothetical protein
MHAACTGNGLFGSYVSCLFEGWTRVMCGRSLRSFVPFPQKAVATGKQGNAALLQGVEAAKNQPKTQNGMILCRWTGLAAD